MNTFPKAYQKILWHDHVCKPLLSWTSNSMHKFLPVTLSDWWASVSAQTFSGINSGARVKFMVAVGTHHLRRLLKPQPDSLEKGAKLTSALRPGQRRGQHDDACVPFLTRALCSGSHSRVVVLKIENSALVDEWALHQKRARVRGKLGSQLWLYHFLKRSEKSASALSTCFPFIVIRTWHLCGGVLSIKYGYECEAALKMLINNKGLSLSGCHQTSAYSLEDRGFSR